MRSTGCEWGSVSDLTSQGTVPNINDINREEVTKIYKTFNFSYRPKCNLTITPLQKHIVAMIDANQYVIVAGPTGCGKTTQVPQFILNSCFDKKIHCNIVGEARIEFLKRNRYFKRHFRSNYTVLRSSSIQDSF